MARHNNARTSCDTVWSAVALANTDVMGSKSALYTTISDDVVVPGGTFSVIYKC